METIKIEVIWMFQKNLSIKHLIKTFNGTRWDIIARGTELQIVQSGKHVNFFFPLPSLNWKLILKIGLQFKLWRTTSVHQYDFQCQRRMIRKPPFRRLKWDAGTQATTRPSVLLKVFDCVITDVRDLSPVSSRCLPHEFPACWLNLSPQPGLVHRFGGSAPQFISTTPKQVFCS